MPIDYSKMSTKALEELEKWDGKDYGKLSDQALQELDAAENVAKLKDEKVGFTKGESAAQGYKQGYTYGLADEIGAAVPTWDEAKRLDFSKTKGAAKTALNFLGADFKDDDVAKYKAVRNANRAVDEQAKAENEYSYAAGDAAGSLLNPTPGLLAAKGLTKVAQTSKALVPLASVGARTEKARQIAEPILKTGAVAATEGGLRGLGHSRAEDGLGLAADVGQQASMEGLMGAGFAGAGKALGTGYEKFAEGVGKFGQRKAVRAIEPLKKEVVAIAGRKGGIENFGKILQEEGIVTAGASLDDIAKRAAQKEEIYGQATGQFMKDLDVMTAKQKLGAPDAPQVPMEFVSPERISERVRKEILEPLADNEWADDLHRAVTNELQKFESKRLGGQIGFEEANKIKTNLYKMIRKVYDNPRNPSPFNDEMKQFAAIINDEIESTAQKNVESFMPQFRDKFKFVKERYGVARTARETAEKGLENREARNFLSPSDKGFGAVGALATSLATGGGVTIPALLVGAGVAGANKVSREHGNQLVSALSQRIAKSPEKLGKYANVLAQAYRKGSAELLATHQELLNDPAYRQTLAE